MVIDFMPKTLFLRVTFFYVNKFVTIICVLSLYFMGWTGFMAYDEIFMKFGMREFSLGELRDVLKGIYSGSSVRVVIHRLLKSRMIVRVGEGRYLLKHPVEVVCTRALRRAALRFAEEVSGVDGVLAVFLVGGVADGFAYRCSDVDVVVVLGGRARGGVEKVFEAARPPIHAEVFDVGDFERELRRNYVLGSRILHSEVLFSRGYDPRPRLGSIGGVPVTDWLVETATTIIGEVEVRRFWEMFRKIVFCAAWFEGVPATSVPMAVVRLSRRVDELRGLDVVLRRAMIGGGLDPRRHLGLLWRFLDFVWGRWARFLGVRRDFLFKLIDGLR